MVLSLPISFSHSVCRFLSLSFAIVLFLSLFCRGFGASSPSPASPLWPPGAAVWRCGVTVVLGPLCSCGLLGCCRLWVKKRRGHKSGRGSRRGCQNRTAPHAQRVGEEVFCFFLCIRQSCEWPHQESGILATPRSIPVVHAVLSLSLSFSLFLSVCPSGCLSVCLQRPSIISEIKL